MKDIVKNLRKLLDRYYQETEKYVFLIEDFLVSNMANSMTIHHRGEVILNVRYEGTYVYINPYGSDVVEMLGDLQDLLKKEMEEC